MKFFTFITLQSALASVLATPLPSRYKLVAKLTTCEHFFVDWGPPTLAFLRAECHGKNRETGEQNRVFTGIDLNRCMMNVNGVMWASRYGYGHIAPGCVNMKVRYENTTKEVLFTAECDRFEPQEIDLAHFIFVDNGELTCFGLREPYCPKCWQPE